MNPGDCIGSYRILGIAGSGAFGQVFKAEHVVTRRVEALKIVSAPDADSSEALQRFRREIEVHARLTHPNIATVHNAFLDHDAMVMAMEFVEGQSLQEMLSAGQVSRDTGIEIVREVLEALAYSHQHGIVHRDVKPANIIITKQGRAKLTDFGVARAPEDVRLTQAGATVGSLMYMAPEQVKGLPSVDPRSDLYSTGVILYEILTGTPPFSCDNAFALMQAQVESEPQPPSQRAAGITPALDDVVMRALHKTPMQRFQTAADFAGALEAALRSEIHPAPRRNARPMRSLYTSLGFAMTAAVGLAVVDVTLNNSAPVEPQRCSRPTVFAATTAAEPAPVLPANPAAEEKKPRKAGIRKPRLAPPPTPTETASYAHDYTETPATAEAGGEDADGAVQEAKPPGRWRRILGKLIPRKKKSDEME